jgi:hypothetical protein
MGWYRSTLLESLTPFFEPILEIAALLFFLASIAVSLGHMIWARKQGVAAALSPFLLNALTVIVVLFVPFPAIQFHAHQRARVEAASAILDGRYESRIRGGGRGDLVVLPPRLAYLSSSGDVMVLHRQDATLIFFFDYRGVLDSFAGFVYSTNDSPPRKGDFGGNFVEIERLRKNWFWATSIN